MAKAILVMNMPTTCSECMLCDLNGCCLALKMVEFCEYRYDQKQKWCPLREVPKKKEYEERQNSFENFGKQCQIDGYNACIDEIVGGE